MSTTIPTRTPTPDTDADEMPPTTHEPVYTWRCTLCMTRNKSAGRFERDRRAPCWIGAHPCRGCGVVSWREGVLILHMGVRERKVREPEEKEEGEEEDEGGLDGEREEEREEEGEWDYGDGDGIIDEDVSMEDVGSLLVPEEEEEEQEKEGEKEEEEDYLPPFRVLKKRFEDISTDGSEL